MGLVLGKTLRNAAENHPLRSTTNFRQANGMRYDYYCLSTSVPLLPYSLQSIDLLLRVSLAWFYPPRQLYGPTLGSTSDLH